MGVNEVIQGDCLETVKKIADESIDSVITSPPYYQLRNYGWDGQWGLEKTYQEYLDKLISLMGELKRVLKPTGTMWINLGDTYNTVSGNMKSKNYQNTINSNMDSSVISKDVYTKPKDIPSKSLCLIPHRFAIRCIDELGLILRNDIIWAKRNGMPESVTDRFSKKHEYFFFMVKNQKYYFDLDGVRDRHLTPIQENRDRKNENYERATRNIKGNMEDGLTRTTAGLNMKPPEEKQNPNGKNPGDVSDFWDIPTKPSSEKHYATFNTDLIDKPIVAGSPEGGIILDPFCGTGTTLARALQLNRKVIGIDGSKEYCEIANKRIENELFQLKLVL